MESSEEAVKYVRVCGITSQKIRQMTPKYRQFASLIVLLRGSIVLWNYKPKNSSNDAEVPTICLVNRSFTMPYTVFLKNYVKLSERNIYFIEFFFQSQ